MIDKALEKITLRDLEVLVQNSVAEGKSIEFKLKLPGNTDGEKKEFLADVSSFANTLGGDLFYGIREEKGVAKKIEGIDSVNMDEEIRKYDNLIRDGIEPRVHATIHSVKVNNEKVILVIHVNKSWVGPHRVIFKGHDKFYARNSAGKYPLDTTELREAFTLTSTLVDKIIKFKNARIAELVAEITPLPFLIGRKIILHLIPLEAFNPNMRVNIKSTNQRLQPIGDDDWGHRINLDGMLTFSKVPNGVAHSYVQLYRSGIIEAVEGYLLHDPAGQKIIPSVTYEKELLASLSIYLSILKDLHINPPILVFLTIAGVRGFKIENRRTVRAPDRYVIDRDVLLLPESFIQTYDTDPKEVLRPLFDLVWNACGYERSYNFDESGKWINR